jgi:CBS domain containing-hemolysin-like protein
MEFLVFAVALTLGLSFLCSLAEATLLSVTGAFVENARQKGTPAGERLYRLKHDVDRPLAAILIINTLANVLGSVAAGARVHELFPQPSAVPATFAFCFAAAILVFSELIPKTLGARYWRQLAGPVALLLVAMIGMAYPLVLMARSVTRRVGGAITGHGGVSREELAAMADLGSRSGELDLQESHIVRNLLRFRSSKVRDIMTPRVVVYLLPEAMTVRQFAAEAMRTPFSRIPVHAGNREDVTGFVLKGDILQAHVRGELERPIGAFRRPLGAVPGTASITQLFNTLIAGKQHVALVIDEFGGMQGVVTLEDVVETLLGLEIVDEADRSPDLQKLARRLWQRRARDMGIELPAEEESPASRPQA